MNAIIYLHKSGYVHRDIKDENIVVDENYNIRLIDFGLIAPIPTESNKFFRSFFGTLHYSAPEIISGIPYRGPESVIFKLYKRIFILWVVFYIYYVLG